MSTGWCSCGTRRGDGRRTGSDPDSPARAAPEYSRGPPRAHGGRPEPPPSFAPRPHRRDQEEVLVTDGTLWGRDRRVADHRNQGLGEETGKVAIEGRESRNPQIPCADFLRHGFGSEAVARAGSPESVASRRRDPLRAVMPPGRDATCGGTPARPAS
jgi:hypothetical protein